MGAEWMRILGYDGGLEEMKYFLRFIICQVSQHFLFMYVKLILRLQLAGWAAVWRSGEKRLVDQEAVQAQQDAWRNSEGFLETHEGKRLLNFMKHGWPEMEARMRNPPSEHNKGE